MGDRLASAPSCLGDVRRLRPATEPIGSLASQARTGVSLVTTGRSTTIRETGEVAMLRLPNGAPSGIPTSVHLADSTLTRCTGNDLAP
ncbi:MAG TPA: hypothetical protein VFH80_25270, partial [Solirubrobacteraceae bacterium]|nr:hypothetical protein [Solirubrobacteraceae bacterium]